MDFYETLDSDKNSVCFKCHFCNVQGDQMIESHWYYNGDFHPKTLKGNFSLENYEYTFNCYRDQIVHIQIKYKQGDSVGIVHFGDNSTSHTCLSTVLVHNTPSHIDVSVMN
jgi:hypothetical protein